MSALQSVRKRLLLSRSNFPGAGQHVSGTGFLRARRESRYDAIGHTMVESQVQRPIRALIAEHHPATRRYLRRCLKAAGCITQQVFNGSDALARAHDDSPDLVFLDLSLPLLDGLTVLADLRLLAPHLKTKFIVLYRAQHPEMLAAAARYDIFDFISTPLSEQRLQKLIDVALQFIHLWSPAQQSAKEQPTPKSDPEPQISRA